jgi:hypothetical protein
LLSADILALRLQPAFADDALWNILHDAPQHLPAMLCLPGRYSARIARQSAGQFLKPHVDQLVSPKARGTMPQRAAFWRARHGPQIVYNARQGSDIHVAAGWTTTCWGTMDWFERLTGFREKSYADTKAKLVVDNGDLRSLVNGKSYRTGALELVSLRDLRERVKQTCPPSAKSKVSAITGDIRRMHRSPENAGALFQVASQFNLLEMISQGHAGRGRRTLRRRLHPGTGLRRRSGGRHHLSQLLCPGRQRRRANGRPPTRRTEESRRRIVRRARYSR